MRTLALDTHDLARVRRQPRRKEARILQVVLSLTPGGTEHLVVEISKRLAASFDVSVCCLDDEGAWAADARAHGVEVVALHRRDGFRPEIGRRIARLAAERRVDLLHCHQYSPFVYAFIACLRVRARSRRENLAPADAHMLFTVANALLTSMTGFVVGGTFLALALNDLTWLTFAMVAALERLSLNMAAQSAPVTLERFEVPIAFRAVASYAATGGARL